MNTTIQKWGNSLAVRLPKEVVQERALYEGSEVTISSDDGRIVITPVSQKKGHVNLAKLLRGITSSNVHKEISWNETRGKEVW